MYPILLTPSGTPRPGEEPLPPLRGLIPANWDEVPLAAFARLASAEKLRPRIEAAAQLCGLPAEPLLADVGIYRAIMGAAPWLFRGPLPADFTRKELFAHNGRSYSFVGDLHRITAGQLEALLDFLNQHADAPLLAAPSLLAVLYCPVGEEQTADVVERTALEFESLPVSVAWPAILDFLVSGASAALHCQNCSAVVNATQQLLRELEAAMTAGVFSTFLSRLRRWLLRMWLRSAGNALSMSSKR